MRKLVLIISILGVLLSVLLSGIYFHFSYFEPDTVSYLFQAKLFAEGKLSVPAPPEHGFSSSPHINILNGKWYSKYPFGNALMLTFGVLINAPWLIPALATGGALFLLYLLVREMDGNSVALIAVVLGLISPATLGMGATWFSEPVSRFFLALYLFALIKTLNGVRLSGFKTGIGYPLLSGFALGYAFNTRPLSAVVFGVVGAGLALYQLVKARTEAQRFRPLITRLGVFLMPFFIMVGVCMAWNAHFTGDAFMFTHTVAQPSDKIGFGKRTEGYEPNLENAFNFTPAWAIERTWKHILPCISFNALGWGGYHHRLLTGESGYSFFGFIIAFVPLLFPWCLALLPFFSNGKRRSDFTEERILRNRYNWLCLALIVGNLLLYAFFYFEGSTWGFTPVNARYYTETTLLAFIPLVARGMFIVYENIRQRKPLIVAASVVLILLSVNTVWSYVRIGRVYQNWSPVYQKLPPMVAERDIHNAVIFVAEHRGAPIGDYPFQNLQEADIVYFKLGPAPRWKLTNSDWQQVYAQYFTGRAAYLYVQRENSLTRLSPDL
ncbi:hypothetical protein C6495_10425 [Candidatus Poribacteria bacterium]|nr:MAG: hypothetical protein C6495_10425 [Candidatus Poribacteria bacterium]